MLAQHRIEFVHRKIAISVLIKIIKRKQAIKRPTVRQPQPNVLGYGLRLEVKP
jgi:hypothetical protein